MRLLALLLLGAVGCVPTVPPSAGTPDDRVQWGSVELPASVCVGNGDGVLAVDEVVIEPGLAPLGAFLVDPAAATVSGLDSRWDLDFEPEADDEAIFLGPEPLAGAWFEGCFPAG